MTASWTPDLMMRVKRVGSVQVAPDGRRAAVTIRQAVMEGEVSEYRTHIHLLDVATQKTQLLTQGDKSCDEPQWSPDGKWIAFVSNRLGKKNIWLISPDGGEAVQLTAIQSDVINFQWSPDGKTIAFIAMDPVPADVEQRAKEKNDARVVDENVRRNRLSVIPITDPPTLQREPRILTSESLNVVSDSSRPGRANYDWSPDGRSIVVAHSQSPAADDWPTADLSLLDVASGALRPLVHSPAAETSPLYSPDGQSVAFLSSDNPPTWAGARTIQVVSAAGGEPRRLPETQDGFGRYSELVGWSADGTRLYFTELQRTIFKVMEMPLSGVDHVVAIGLADPDRLGVMGWSYGGFMTSWTITQTKRFKAASVGAGVTNLVSFTGTADIPSFLPDYFGGEYWDKPDAYRLHSAMFHVKGVTTPTLIQHGERDERVPLSQGQELYNALKRQGCATKLIIYPRTPHAIEEPRLLLDCMNRNLDWFDHYLSVRKS